MFNQMEMTMRKTALTILGALLMSGIAVQMAAASEHHRQHVTKASFSRHHTAHFQGAYNRINGPINVSVTPSVLLSHDSDFRRFDPSWVGDRDPSLDPAD